MGTTFYLLHTGGYIPTNPLTSLVMAPTCSYCSTCSPSILIPQLGFQENDTLRSGILYILHINTPRWVIWIQSISVGICWWLSGSAYILRRYNKPPKWCPGITLRCVDQQRSNIWEVNLMTYKTNALHYAKENNNNNNNKKHLSHANQPERHQPCLTLPKMCYFRRKSTMLAWAKRGHQSHGATPVWLILTNHQRNECKHSFVSTTE